MRHITTTIGGHRSTHNAEAAVFWIFAGIIILIAIGDALAVLAAAIAIVTAISWVYRKVEHRSERSGTEMAPVTRLLPELTGQRDFENTSAHASRRFHRAA
jgi:flagellar basal body-associated protein FliL